MTAADISPVVEDGHAKSRFGADGYVLIVGLVAVAALGIGRLIWEPSFAQKQQAMETTLASEHMKICDQLGKSNGTDRQNCMKLLDGLYTTHQRTMLADTGDI